MEVGLASAFLRTSAAFVLFFALAFPLSPVFAQTAPSGRGTRLEYVRAPGAEACPDEATFREALAAQMPSGADPFVPSGPNLLRVTLAPASPGAGFNATMELFGSDGRAIGADTKQAPTCAAAVRAQALGASVLLVSSPAAPVPPLPAAPVVTTPPRPVPTIAPLLPPAPPLPPVVRVQLGAGGLVVLGTAPNPSAGFAGFVGLRFPRLLPAFGFTLEGRADLGASGGVVALARGAAQARASFAGGSVAPCLHGRWFFGCGVFTIGAVRGSAGEAYAPAEQAALFAGLGGRVGAEIMFVEGRPSFGVRLAVDGLFTLVRPEVYADAERIWQAPSASGSAGVYLVTLF